MSALPFILQHKVVAILRGMPSNEILNIAHALYSGGIRLLEVTLNSQHALAAIEQLSSVYKDRMLIGAGTVLTVQDATNAMDAGAMFLISPTLDIDVINTTKKAGRVSIPGGYTPTEILLAFNHGADIVKVFPAPGAAYIKNVLAPLNHIPLMPTGGIDAGNIRQFANAGAVAFGIGSALVDSKAPINEAYFEELAMKAKQLMTALNQS